MELKKNEEYFRRKLKEGKKRLKRFSEIKIGTKFRFLDFDKNIVYKKIEHCACVDENGQEWDMKGMIGTYVLIFLDND